MVKCNARKWFCLLIFMVLPVTAFAEEYMAETEKVEDTSVPKNAQPIPARVLSASSKRTVYFVQPHFKVYPHDPFKRLAGKPREVGLCRGEYEPFQIVVTTPHDIPAVTVEASNLPRGVTFECQPVGLVNIQASKAVVRTGLTPDPLYNDPKIDVKGGQAQVFWITLHAARDAQVGAFSLSCRVLSGEDELATFQLPARVRDFLMPVRPHLASMVEFRPWNDKDHYKDETGRLFDWPLERQMKLYRAYYRWYQRNRMQPGSVFPRPRIRKDDNGEVVIEDAETTAKYINECFRDFPGVFDVIWIQKLMGYGQEFYDPKSEKGKEKIDFIRRYVKLYVDFAKKNGWAMDRMVWYAGDEPIMPHARHKPKSKDMPIRSINACVRAVRPVLDGLPVLVSAWPFDRELLSSVDIWAGRSYGHPSWNPERMELKEAIAYGKAIALTTDNSYNIMMDRQCINYRMDPMQAWYACVPMIEHWSNMYWQATPWSPKGKWPGDGNLCYPPPSETEVISSIRAELMREGMEDYEYLWLLRHASYVIRTSKRGGEENDLLRRIDLLLWDMHHWIVTSTARHSDSDYIGMCSNVPADRMPAAADELDDLREKMQETLEEVNQKGFLDPKVTDAGQKPIRQWIHRDSD